MTWKRWRFGLTSWRVWLAAIPFILIASGLTYSFLPKRQLNLLVITLDTVRADRLGCYGYQPAVTPTLDALAATGVVFYQAYSTAPVTLPSHATMFTGLHPAEHGLRTNGRGRLGKSVPTLAEILKQHAYETGAFVGSFVLDSKFGLDHGFDTYDDELARTVSPSKVAPRERSGQAVVDSALSWLKGRKQHPFFCWVHLYDAHYPYQAHEDQFGERFTSQPYDGELAYVDLQVSRLLDYLKSQNLDESTLVVVVGDHGEGLDDHQERRHGSFLYDTTLRVPWLLRSPRSLVKVKEANRHIGDRVSLVEFLPTVLEVLQVSTTAKLKGRSLAGVLEGKPVTSRPCYATTDEPFLELGWSPLRCLSEGRWKYLHTPRPELYDIDADPAESRNLVDSHPEELERMKHLLEQFESDMVERETGQLVLSSQERRVMESLGYAGGSTAIGSRDVENSLPDMKDMIVYWNAVDDAIQFREHGQLDAAIERLEFVVRGAPATVMAYVYLGNALDSQGNVSAAESAYRTALKYNSKCGLAHYYLGDLALRRKDFAEAATEYGTSLECDPSLSEAHFKLGNLFQQQGDLTTARSHFEAAIRIDPAYATAHTNLGNIFVWQGRLPEAEQQYRTALRLSAGSVEANLNLASLLTASGRTPEAEALLVNALQLAPNDRDLQKKLAEVRDPQKRPK